MPSATVPHQPNGTVTFGDPHLHVDGDVLALCFSSEGAGTEPGRMILLSIQDTGTLCGWDTATGNLLSAKVLSDLEMLWRFSHDGKFLVSASSDLSIWSPEKAELLVAIPQDSWVTAAEFHPNSKMLATGHDDGKVRYWDLNTQQLLATFDGHPDSVSALAFRTDGKVLASAGEDKLIVLWDLDNSTKLGVLEGHKDRIPEIVWHLDGKTLVSAGWDTTARVWNTETFEPIILLNSHDTQVLSLAFSPDGSTLASSDSGHTIHLWDFANKTTKHLLRQIPTPARSLAFAPDGKLLAAGGEGLIQLWDAIEGTPLSRSTSPKPTSISTALSPKGDRIAINGSAGLHVWDTTSRTPVLTLEESEPVNHLAYSPDGLWIAGGTDKYTRIWDAATGKPKACCEGLKEPTTVLAFSADSQTLASASRSGIQVWLWDPKTGEPVLLIPRALEGALVETIDFHPNNRVIAVGGLQSTLEELTGSVSFWDIVDRCELDTVPAGSTCLKYHPQGNFLVVADLDCQLNVYDAESRRQLTELPGHEDTIRALAFSADGTLLASSGDDRSIRLWDTATWAARTVVREVESQIKTLAFSPDGKFLYTGNGNSICYRLEVDQM
ncbi:MAG: WD40 repeat domain-containing protein [Gemmataceae bacterium]